MSGKGEPGMMPADFDPEAYVDIAGRLVGLEIAAAHRPGVVLHLGLIARMAGLVSAFPLTPREEPAPTFNPGGGSSGGVAP